jgi:peptidoglycan glycosyltransferase
MALSAGLVYWQVVVAKAVTTNPYLTYTRGCTSEAAPVRGKIFDRNGVLLAYSVPSNDPNLCGYKRVYTTAAQGLEGLLGYYISPVYASSGVEKQFNDYLNGTQGLTGLDNQVNQILHVPPQGDDIYLTIDSRIEKILLKNFPIETPVSQVGPTEVYKTDRGSVIVADPRTGEILGIISQPGYDANCVIECSLATLRADMLAKDYTKALGCPGSCTMDQFKNALDNAAVLSKQGLSSACADPEIDDCNLIYLNYLNSDPEQPLLFRPTQDCYPPGSVYKTTTLMAAIDSGTLALHDRVFYNDAATHPYPEHLQARGPVTVTGPNNESETFQPSISNTTNRPVFPVDLAFGFSHSDNIIFLEAGVKTGAETWVKYNQALYVGQQIPFDLPVKVSTVTPQPQSHLCTYQPQAYTPLTVTTLAENAFGQGRDFVTPLQMMVINNVAADDGKLMRPTVIQKIVDPKNGAVLQSFTPIMLRQVISQASAVAVRDAMYGVNQCGSGLLSGVLLSYPYTNWSVIGKTGTAQVDSSGVTPADSWYITQAPYIYQSGQIPPITITAMKENGGEGAYANGPMLNAIYNQIFTQVMTSVHTNPVPPGGLNFCTTTTHLLPN